MENYVNLDATMLYDCETIMQDNNMQMWNIFVHNALLFMGMYNLMGFAIYTVYHLYFKRKITTAKGLQAQDSLHS